MSDFMRLNVRPEVQACLRSCEYVLSTASTTGHQPFSEDERQLLTYYVAELAKMMDRRIQGSATATCPESISPPLRSEPPSI